ncbi:MAG: helix-turn-helix transcriptional regulator [Saprospiraceae bacterium]|nr:MAG: AraC family transcriptional regulator [Bacteroidetes bacterium OLB9]MCO6464643.1 helix-turn-helix transcriptional regulator [Saprospiraceae bacterium]MCZ2339010.1 AraC family transcriptional regulator [Chitinophagales bacterium]
MIRTTDTYYPTSGLERCFLKSIWRLQAFYQHHQMEVILPKGTVEVIFNLSDHITYTNPGADVRMNLPCCFINGINFKPLQLIKTGQQIFLGIQFNALGLKVVFDIPAREFNNTVVEGSLVCKALTDLYYQLFSEKSFDRQVEIIRKWLCQKISTSKHLTEIQKLHDWFYCQNVNALTVKEFCNKACISDRQLRRISTDWIGMNTEKFLLYNKYLSALHLLHHTDLTLTQIGLEAGFYDQSHFIREFKFYTGLIPKEYQASVTGLPGHIFH